MALWEGFFIDGIRMGVGAFGAMLKFTGSAIANPTKKLNN
jgi:hypothetical protein